MDASLRLKTFCLESGPEQWASRAPILPAATGALDCNVPVPRNVPSRDLLLSQLMLPVRGEMPASLYFFPVGRCTEPVAHAQVHDARLADGHDAADLAVARTVEVHDERGDRLSGLAFAVQVQGVDDAGHGATMLWRHIRGRGRWWTDR